MAPEAVSLLPLTTAADIWSAGAIAYFMYVSLRDSEGGEKERGAREEGRERKGGERKGGKGEGWRRGEREGEGGREGEGERGGWGKITDNYPY